MALALVGWGLPRPQSSPGPQVRPPSLSLAFPSVTYAGPRIWYNFSVTSALENLTWNLLTVSVQHGPLTRAETNWSLTAHGPGGAVVASFLDTAGNWTTIASGPVAVGDQLVLETDSSLALGGLNVSWGPSGAGGFSLAPL